MGTANGRYTPTTGTSRTLSSQEVDTITPLEDATTVQLVDTGAYDPNQFQGLSGQSKKAAHQRISLGASEQEALLRLKGTKPQYIVNQAGTYRSRADTAWQWDSGGAGTVDIPGIDGRMHCKNPPSKAALHSHEKQWNTFKEKYPFPTGTKKAQYRTGAGTEGYAAA